MLVLYNIQYIYNNVINNNIYASVSFSSQPHTSEGTDNSKVFTMKLEAWPGVLGSPVSWDVHA